jgi:hypothetical protein
MPNNRFRVVGDGDVFSVLSKVNPTSSATDDRDYPYIYQAFRIVVDGAGPTLAFVPLTASPIRISAQTAKALEGAKTLKWLEA